MPHLIKRTKHRSRIAVPKKVRAVTADRLMRIDEVVAIVGLDPSTIFRMEQRGEFPRRRKITRHAVGWVATEIWQWIRQRPVAQLIGAPEDRSTKVAAPTDNEKRPRSGVD